MAMIKRVINVQQSDDEELRTVAQELGVTPTALCRILIRGGLRRYRTNGRLELAAEKDQA